MKEFVYCLCEDLYLTNALSTLAWLARWKKQSHLWAERILNAMQTHEYSDKEKLNLFFQVSSPLHHDSPWFEACKNCEEFNNAFELLNLSWLAYLDFYYQIKSQKLNHEKETALMKELLGCVNSFLRDMQILLPQNQVTQDHFAKHLNASKLLIQNGGQSGEPFSVDQPSG
jgi:hypothetical protein